MTSIWTLSGDGVAGRSGEWPWTTASSSITRQPPHASSITAQDRKVNRMSIGTRRRRERRAMLAECHPANEKRAA
jgi:hypothetical protein